MEIKQSRVFILMELPIDDPDPIPADFSSNLTPWLGSRVKIFNPLEFGIKFGV